MEAAVAYPPYLAVAAETTEGRVERHTTGNVSDLEAISNFKRCVSLITTARPRGVVRIEELVVCDVSLFANTIVAST